MKLYFNKKVTELWDLSKNVSLQSLEVYNYEKLHTIDGVQKAKKLEYFAIGDYVSEHTVIDSFSPLIKIYRIGSADNMTMSFNRCEVNEK